MTGKRVLYIDDDAGIRRLVGRAMERRGYHMTLAESGADGIAMARAEPYDLIAVDHYMPGMDGLETLNVLRELPDAPPVVYVTGSDEGRIAVADPTEGRENWPLEDIDPIWNGYGFILVPR